MIVADAVISDVPLCLVQLPVCNKFDWENLLEQMLSKDNQVLDINDAVAERCRANITQGIVLAPVVNHYAHIVSIYNSVAIKVR